MHGMMWGMGGMMGVWMALGALLFLVVAVVVQAFLQAAILRELRQRGMGPEGEKR